MPGPKRIFNAEGGLVKPGIYHALILLKVKNPNNEAEKKNIVFDMCWKNRILEWTDKDLAESQRLLSIEPLGARLPRAVDSLDCQSDTFREFPLYPKWRLKSQLKIGKFFDTAINVERVRYQRPWNPKFYNCHDFVADVLPELLMDGGSAEFLDLLENGMLNTRKRAEVLFGGQGSCMSKAIELYVRYVGGVSGSSRKLAKQDLTDPTAMIYSGYNSHPLQQGSTGHQICSVEWEIIEACVLFRAQPMGHGSVAPLGVRTSAVIDDYRFKANFLKDFQIANNL